MQKIPNSREMNQKPVTMDRIEETNIERVQAVYNFTWIIKNYQQQDWIRSTAFRIDKSPNKSKCFISLYKSQLTKIDADFQGIVTFQVHYCNEEKTSLNPVKIRLSIGTMGGNKKIFNEIIYTSTFEYSMKELYLLPLLTSDGSLHVNLEIELPSPSIKKQSIISDEKNFKSFLNSQFLSDVIFKIDEDEIPAHKVILASVSSIFREMFSHQAEGNFTSIVKIKGVEPNVFKEFLSYIYTGRVTNLENMSSGLYELSNKYDIPNLRQICEDHLCESLLVDNVISVLQLADRFNSVNLKNKCFEYINTHFVEVRETESFKNLQSEAGTLIMDLLCAVKIKKQKT